MLGGALFIVVFALTIMIYGLKVVGGAILESHAFIHMLDAPMYALLAVGVLGLYLRQIVLPLLGLDFGYGLEARDYQIYLAIGLTD